MNEVSSILFLGDVVPYKAFKFGNNLKTIINLECPIIKEGIPVSGKVNLSVKENFLKNSFGSNLLAVSLGSNHILDYGIEGLNLTIRQLENAGIDYFGVNNPQINRHNPLIIEFGKLKIAFLSAVSESTSPIIEFDDFNYLNLLDTEELSCSIRNIRSHVDRIIIYVHWGVEESSYPSRNDIITGRKLIDEGVDLIIGSHSHAPQPVEKYKNGIIAYNLGNFIMPAFEKVPSYFDENGVAQSDFSKRLMLWNRISWGLVVDMETMEFRIKKYAFIADRILELNATPLDKYTELRPGLLDESYENVIKRHLKKREFHRKIRDFIHYPNILP
jgi:hypothetical protein